MQPIRVLLVEDHTFFRESLALLLAETPAIEVVGQAATGAEALAFLSDWHAPDRDVDVVIFDLHLPDISGVDLAVRIQQAFGTSPALLMLTGSDDPAALRAALEKGVRGCLHKASITPGRLFSALPGLGNGLVVLGPSALPLLTAAG